MKKLYVTAFLFLAAVSHLLSPTNVEAYPNGSNFLANYSGSHNVTCNNTNCHTGAAVNSGPGSVSIVTDIPVTGYVNGQTYNIQVTVTSGGSNGVKYGFACAAVVEGTTTLVGGFATSDNTTLIKSGGNYIVHSTAPNGNGNPSHTFSFEWTAPAGGTGSVTFFAAGNSANGNGNSSGDQIYNTNTTVIEMPGFGLTESIVSAFNLYPNPASELVNVKVPESLMDSQIRLMDITGKVVLTQQLTQSIVSIDVNTIPAGIYVVEVLKDGKSYTSRLIKN